jgi:hypothetical protein
MICLIHYNRLISQTVLFKEYADSDYEVAQRDRFKLELKYNLGDPAQEIILLEASSIEQLQQTHAKYFENGLEKAVAAFH